MYDNAYVRLILEIKHLDHKGQYPLWEQGLKSATYMQQPLKPQI
jgi:hypothetical protein